VPLAQGPSPDRTVAGLHGVDIGAVVAAVRRARPDVPIDVIRTEVDRSAWGFREATIPNYLPVLIERRVRLHLRLEWPPPEPGA